MGSGTKCNICGVSGTSTKRCCGNNPQVRIKELDQMIAEDRKHIIDLQVEILDFLNEKAELIGEENGNEEKET